MGTYEFARSEVTMSESSGSNESRVEDGNSVMYFVTLFDTTKDRDSFRNRRFVNDDLLEPAEKRKTSGN